MADKALYWFIGTKKHARNTALKNLQNISQVLRWGVRREVLDKNPMDLYKYKLQAPKAIVYLSPEEVVKLTALPLPSQALANVRDCFILQCWTGLAYADLMALDMAQCAETTASGLRVLRVRRAKSTITHGYECVIPLLPEAEQILARFADKVPAYSNQYYNRALKGIGELSGLAAGQMTSHVGRKTAGVTMLNRGIRMEVVSKFLGHSSVKMTEKVYAKILDKTVLNEFERVFASVPAPTSPTENGRVVPMWKGGLAA